MFFCFLVQWGVMGGGGVGFDLRQEGAMGQDVQNTVPKHINKMVV